MSKYIFRIIRIILRLFKTALIVTMIAGTITIIVRFKTGAPAPIYLLLYIIIPCLILVVLKRQKRKPPEEEKKLPTGLEEEK